MATIRNQKDFGAGVLYLAFGAVGFYIARDYGFGQASRMGPGYFPSVLSALLMMFGAIAVIRSFIKPGEDIGTFAWKAAVYVVGSNVLFGLLLIPAGLIVALVALILSSAAASMHFKFDWKAAGALIVLVVFCALVFVKGLGVPMPLLGTWFGG
ncbi:MAG: tripartite tricarboxylate transporter TctB family protein [Burkholderiales bacterium]